MNPLFNRRCSSGENSGYSREMYDGLVTAMERQVYLGGVQELITIKDSQQGIVDCDFLILQNNPFASKRSTASTIFGKAKKLRLELNNLIGFKDGNQNLYTGFPQVNNVIDSQWKLTEELYSSMAGLCDLQIVGPAELIWAKN